jgi:hypothetical protein
VTTRCTIAIHFLGSSLMGLFLQSVAVVGWP